MRKYEVLAQCHIATKELCWDLNPGNLTLGSRLFAITMHCLSSWEVRFRVNWLLSQLPIKGLILLKNLHEYYES